MRTARILAPLLGLGLLGLLGACGHGQLPLTARPATAAAGSPPNPNASSTTSKATNAFALADTSAIAPLALTSSDGTGLRVAGLDAKVHLFGPITMTEVHATFENPLRTTVEGRFRITLPPRSSMTRLAMKIGGEWREADAAELGAARETYEEILHRRRDPLLVEQRREREISARVFPIFGHELKEIAVAYTTELESSNTAAVTFPLRGMPEIGKLDVSIIDGATEPFALHLENERPNADATFVPRSSEIARSGDLIAVRVPVGGSASAVPDPIAAPIVFVVETSGSKAADLEATASMIASIADQLSKASGSQGSQAKPTVRASVIAYDQSMERLYDGELSALSGTIAKVLAAREALGASDLALGFASAADEAKRIGATRVVFVGGGAPTVGASEPKRLREAAIALAASGVERLDVLGTSALADLRVYRPLVVTSNGGFRRHGAVIDDATRLDPAIVTKRLTTRTLPRTSVAIEGAAWTMPSTFDGVSAGEERVVLASLPLSSTPIHARINDTTRIAIDSASRATPRTILDHQIAAAKLEGFMARGERDGFDDALKTNIIGLARQHRLASPFTALLVLESEADRQMLRSKEQSQSSASLKPRPLAPPPPPAPPPTSSFGVLSGSHKTKPVSLRVAQVQVNGRVPPEVIQRIVRQRMGTFRGCYEEGLRRRGSTLAGRVAVRFVIGRDGSVIQSQDGGSDLPDPKTVSCIVEGFRQLAFPQPEGGIITVVYPLVLSPDGNDGGPTPAPMRLPINQPCGSCRSATAAALEEQQQTPSGPWSRSYASVMNLLSVPSGSPIDAGANAKAALALARDLHAHDITNPIALALLGQTLEAVGDRDRAARAYGSIADLYPERAEMLRAAGVRIDRIHAGNDVAISLLRRAANERSDQPSSHHLLGLALLRAGKYEAAFDAFAKGSVRRYELRYAGVGDLFAIDLGLVVAAWGRAEPHRAIAIAQRGALFGAKTQDRPTHIAMASWETDTSDVEIITRSASGQENRMAIAYASDGFGPEAIELGWLAAPTQKQNAIVRLQTRGSGGEILGVVDIVKHDGRGDVSVEPRPFAIMNERAELDLGAIE